MRSPERDLTVGAFALDIKHADPADNLSVVRDTLTSLPHHDLFVVPEMFSTGYIKDPRELKSVAEPSDGPTMQYMQRLADELDCAIWGTFLACDEEKYFNRGFMLTPHGKPTFYDKHHLFTHGGENLVYTAGSSAAPTVEVGTWRLKMAICYDLRFGVWCRNRNLDYDALIVPANWPTVRDYAWQHLLIARAIENQAYVVGADRTGQDIGGDYALDQTAIYDHWGKSVGKTDTTMSVVSATFEAARINRDRQRFAPWRDADDFKLYV